MLCMLRNVGRGTGAAMREGGCSEGGGDLGKRGAGTDRRQGMFLLKWERGGVEDSVGKWTGSASISHICTKGPMELIDHLLHVYFI